MTIDISSIPFCWKRSPIVCREKNMLSPKPHFLKHIEFISQNNPGVICSGAASTGFLIWHQMCHCRLISQPCPEYRWWIGPLGVMTRNTTGEQNMKNRLHAAVGWISKDQTPCVPAALWWWRVSPGTRQWNQPHRSLRRSLRPCSFYFLHASL